jgi:Ca2+-binding EF-hand superfamily protein
MGSCIGTGFRPNSAKPGQGINVFTICNELGYSKGDLSNMYKFFKSMDVYGTGLVSVRAYCAIYGISDAFGDRIFQKMIGSEKNEMNFEEFLISSWNSLSFFDQNDLAIFTFELFDVDASGVLSSLETENMVHIIWGENAKKNKVYRYIHVYRYMYIFIYIYTHINICVCKQKCKYIDM